MLKRSAFFLSEAMFLKPVVALQASGKVHPIKQQRIVKMI